MFAGVCRVWCYYDVKKVYSCSCFTSVDVSEDLQWRNTSTLFHTLTVQRQYYQILQFVHHLERILLSALPWYNVTYIPGAFYGNLPEITYARCSHRSAGYFCTISHETHRINHTLHQGCLFSFVSRKGWAQTNNLPYQKASIASPILQRSCLVGVETRLVSNTYGMCVQQRESQRNCSKIPNQWGSKELALVFGQWFSVSDLVYCVYIPLCGVVFPNTWPRKFRSKPRVHFIILPIFNFSSLLTIFGVPKLALLYGYLLYVHSERTHACTT